MMFGTSMDDIERRRRGEKELNKVKSPSVPTPKTHNGNVPTTFKRKRLVSGPVKLNVKDKNAKDKELERRRRAMMRKARGY